jgi:uncharacterized delta-60 repeat protein
MRPATFLFLVSLTTTGLAHASFPFRFYQSPHPIASSVDSVVEGWVRLYNGPGNSSDESSALAIDIDGNVFVTGSSLGPGTGFDFATIKYDASGTEQWVARYNGPEDSFATALAIDPEGNVYVTGWSEGSGSNFDFATIKYDASGTEQWVARYNGPENSVDGANSLAVDPEGNVYVAGQSWGSGTNYDYATIKYNASGTEKWVARYDGPGNWPDWVNDIAVDAEGNVYVTGYSTGSGTASDYATIKYDSSGEEEWVARYDGPGNSYDESNDLAIDIDGNVHVTGSSYGSGTASDYATIKYDSSGVEVWVVRYDGPADSSDQANALVLDAEGNVYVTGYCTGSGTHYDYTTIRYNTSGMEEGAVSYNGPGNHADRATALAVDSEGNVYVTGQSWASSTTEGYATIKYDGLGMEQWVARYDTSEGNYSEEPTALAVDPEGNVYVTWSSWSSVTNFDYSTIKYTQRLSSIVEENEQVPTVYSLHQNYPNPFNPSTIIGFTVPRSVPVKLEVFNVLGERVSMLGDGIEAAGYHSVVFDAEGLPSGIYFYRLQAGDFVETKKLALVR